MEIFAGKAVIWGPFAAAEMGVSIVILLLNENGAPDDGSCCRGHCRRIHVGDSRKLSRWHRHGVRVRRLVNVLSDLHVCFGMGLLPFTWCNMLPAERYDPRLLPSRDDGG